MTGGHAKRPGAAAYDQHVPTYDFECTVCGERYEAMAPAGGEAPCPACGSTRVRRLFSGFAGPFTVGLRGQAARRSNAKRAAREEQRRERREARKADGGRG
jgi:putative FmdB family regulatory protein